MSFLIDGLIFIKNFFTVNKRIIIYNNYLCYLRGKKLLEKFISLPIIFSVIICSSNNRIKI